MGYEDIFLESLLLLSCSLVDLFEAIGSLLEASRIRYRSSRMIQYTDAIRIDYGLFK